MGSSNDLWTGPRAEGAASLSGRSRTRCVLAYTWGWQQVAFARVVSDRAVFAYLMDVFVIPEYRGRGISKALMRAVPWIIQTSKIFGYFFLVRTTPTDSTNSSDFGRWRSPSSGCRFTIPTATSAPPNIGLERCHARNRRRHRSWLVGTSNPRRRQAIRISDEIAIYQTEIEERFVRASGPGGQHVNKVSTAVELRVDIAGSSLPAHVKQRLAALAGGRMTGRGIAVNANGIPLEDDGGEHEVRIVLGAIEEEVPPRVGELAEVSGRLWLRCRRPVRILTGSSASDVAIPLAASSFPLAALHL